MTDYFEKNCKKANENWCENAVLLDHTTPDDAFFTVRLDQPFSMRGGVAIADYVGDDGVRRALISTGSHTLIVGSTGSGKTQGFYMPQIELLARAEDNVSFVTMDMKGTMYKAKADLLKKHGFTVIAINGKDPFSSVRYNPLRVVYRAYHNAHEARKRVEETPFGKEEYEFGGQVFSDYHAWVREAEAYYNEQIELCNQMITLIVATLVPIESNRDVSWEYGARDIIECVIQMMLEDSLMPELGMTEKKFTLYNLSRLVNERSDDYRVMRRMLSVRAKTSPARKLANYVESQAKVTRDSYMMVAGSKLARVVNQTMNVMSSGSEVDVDSIVARLGKERLAIFLVADSSNKSAYTLCNLFLVQLLTKLQRRGDETTDGDFHVFADEFCNMVPMPEMEDWITTMRSRRVWLHLGIQSFSQLDSHYDQNMRNTVLGNSKTLFMGSNDYETLRTFSESLGQTLGVSNNYAMNNDGAVSLSSTAIPVPLVRISDLAGLRLGQAYVRVFGPYGNKIVRTVLDPDFRCETFAHDNVPFEARKGDYFDPERVFYDVMEAYRRCNVKEPDDDEDEVRNFFGEHKRRSEEKNICESLTTEEKKYLKKLFRKADYAMAADRIANDDGVLRYRPGLVRAGVLSHGFGAALGLSPKEYEKLVAKLFEPKAKKTTVMEEKVADETEERPEDLEDFFKPEREPVLPRPRRTSFFDERENRREEAVGLVKKQIVFEDTPDGWRFILPNAVADIHMEVVRTYAVNEINDLGATIAFCNDINAYNPAYSTEKVEEILDHYGVEMREEEGRKILYRPLSEKGRAMVDVFAFIECVNTLRNFAFLFGKDVE